MSSPVVFLSTIAGSRYNWHYNVLRKITQRDYTTLKPRAIAVYRHLFAMRSFDRKRVAKLGLVWGRRLGSSVRQQNTAFQRNVPIAVRCFRLRVGFISSRPRISLRSFGDPQAGAIGAIGSRLTIRDLVEERYVFRRKLYID